MLKDFAIDAEDSWLNSQAGQIGHSVSNGSQPCDVSLELRCPGAKPRGRAPPFAITFRYNNEFNETSIIKIWLDLKKKKFVCSHSYCRYPAVKETPTS